MSLPFVDDEMGSGVRLVCLPDHSGDMIVVLETPDFKQRLKVEITRSPLRRPKVHAALKALSKAIEEESL